MLALILIAVGLGLVGAALVLDHLESAAQHRVRLLVAREAYHAERLRGAVPYLGPRYTIHDRIVEDDTPRLRRIL